MGTELAAIEKQLTALCPRFDDVLRGSGIAPAQIVQTVMVSIDRTPAVAKCTVPSILQAAMSAACLGLVVDGVTGQAFLIPFAGKAQLVIGYKGYNTLAARSGYSITAGVVREGDAFECDLAQGFISHKPKLGGETNRRIIAAWAMARSKTLPPIPMALSIDQLMQVKGRSQGARRKDSPWNDTEIGFAAMCEKTARRRLARSMPMNIMQVAARMDEAAEEQGQHAYVTPDDGLVINGTATEIEPGEQETKEPPAELHKPPTFGITTIDGEVREAPTIARWRTAMLKAIDNAPDIETLDRWWKLQAEHLAALSGFPGDVETITDAYHARKGEG